MDKRKRFLDLHFLGQNAILEVGSNGNQFLSVHGTIRRKSAFFDSIGHAQTKIPAGSRDRRRSPSPPTTDVIAAVWPNDKGVPGPDSCTAAKALHELH